VSVDGLRELRAASGQYHGAIRKWFKPQQLLSTIRAVLTAQPQLDEAEVPDGGTWRELAMQDAVDHERNRDEALAMILEQLQLGLGATAVALLQFNCGTRQTTLIASVGLNRQHFDTARTSLDKSPVRDIVEDHRCYRVTDTSWEDAAFRHLYKIFPQHHVYNRPTFRSFLGMRLVDFGRGFAQTDSHERKSPVGALASEGGRESYALLAFHQEANEFSSSGTQFFCRTAALILAVLERDAMRRELVKFAEYVLVARQASFLLHEFRTRVSAMQVWNGLLEGDIDAIAAKRLPLPDQIDQLRATSTSLKRVAAGLSQINELFLNLSVEGKKSFRIGSLIDELRLVFRQPLRDLNVCLESDVKWDEEISCNRGHVTQILSNLIQNALDQFRIAECKSPEIRVLVEKYTPTDADSSSENHIRMTVADNGIGISRINYANIFEYNFTTKPDGSGIGLHVSRLIAENLRGSLVLETSERFLQTRFVVTIPI
jgi:signal transduction histidine kinase